MAPTLDYLITRDKNTIYLYIMSSFNLVKAVPTVDEIIYMTVDFLT